MPAEGEEPADEMQGEEIVEDEEERAPAPRPRKLRAPGGKVTTRWSGLGPKEIVRDMVCAAFPLHVCCRACFLPRAFLLLTLACKGESVYLLTLREPKIHCRCTYTRCEQLSRVAILPLSLSRSRRGSCTTSARLAPCQWAVAAAIRWAKH